MEPEYIDHTPLAAWMSSLWKKGLITYILLACLTYFYLKLGVVLSILYIGIRTEVLISSLRYGDTVNSRRLEIIEDNTETEIDYDKIHSTKG